MKYYNQTTSNEFNLALSVDPFKDSKIASRRSDAISDARTSQNDAERESKKEKTPVIVSLPEPVEAKSYPTRTRT